jgi:uncharacterized membrane protein
MKVLIAGESWVIHMTHIKGFDHFNNSVYEEGVGPLRDSLERNGISVDFLPNHEAPTKFPTSLEELKAYDAIILSDIGANTLLLSPDTFSHSKFSTNRLALIQEYVDQGGGFMMIGGYMSFQGIEGKARYKDTPIESILPVELLPYDDRFEAPEGAEIRVIQPDHPILNGIPQDWPKFLGYNKLKIKDDAVLLAEHEGNTFIAVKNYGKGRTMAFASDCSPHWGTPEFVQWPYYPSFWAQSVNWLAGKS